MGELINKNEKMQVIFSFSSFYFYFRQQQTKSKIRPANEKQKENCKSPRNIKLQKLITKTSNQRTFYSQY